MNLLQRERLVFGLAIALAMLAAWGDRFGMQSMPAIKTLPHVISQDISRAKIGVAGKSSAPEDVAISKNTSNADSLENSTIDLFRIVSFLPPPPKAVAPPPPPPPPKPVAPAFPYQYFGTMVDVNGKLVTYLTRNNMLIPIHSKETLDNEYHIDSLSDSQIVITYLPLKEKTTITIKSAAQ